MAIKSQDKHERRKTRVRAKIQRLATGRARLSVHRTNANIYAQIIDDVKGVTLASASTLDKDIKAKLKVGSNKDATVLIGKLVGERALKAGVKEVVFDRGGYLFHGRVKALADAAREAGLAF